MAAITITGSQLGTPLQEILMCEGIEPGSTPSYTACKLIYEYHVLGQKMVEAPISMAQSQTRKLSVTNGPEDRLKMAFIEEWQALVCDRLIFNVMRLSRIYGIASVALMPDEGRDPNTAVDFASLYKKTVLNFNVFDPLNTSGSLVLNQQPNDPLFLKIPASIAVAGKPYHPSRSISKLNEEPIYLGYTTSAYGYVGRSVYQRALYMLKSYIHCIETDDLVAVKAGVIVAKMNPAGSVVTGPMQWLTGIKRNVVKEAQHGNIISISPDEEIETLNMQNLDGAYGMARSNILKNIATAADMPARILENETMVSGFGEGTEDAKNVAQYIDRFRMEMQPIYEYFDNIVMYRAWNPDFYEAIQADFPEYRKKDFKQVFTQWRDSFVSEWPSFLTEPDSEKAKVDDIKLKGVISLVEVLAPMLDPDNKATLVEWAAANLNENKIMFPIPLILDIEALAEYVPPVPDVSPETPKPFAAQDSATPVKLVRK